VLAQCLQIGIKPPTVNNSNKALYYILLEHAKINPTPLAFVKQYSMPNNSLPKSWIFITPSNDGPSYFTSKNKSSNLMSFSDAVVDVADTVVDTVVDVADTVADTVVDVADTVADTVVDVADAVADTKR
jgi:hypothetical protein